MKLSKKTVQDLKNGKIEFDELSDRYFIDSQDTIEVENVLKLLKHKICDFKQIADKYKDLHKFHHFLKDIELFSTLDEIQHMTYDDLKYLLNKIDKWYELDKLCENTLLIQRILTEFVLDIETVNKINSLMYIHNMFDCIRIFNRGNEELLKLNELHKKVYTSNSFDLNKDQKSELIELIKNNETARNRLIQIIDNYLESNYSFDSLMDYLKKKEKKSLLNI